MKLQEREAFIRYMVEGQPVRPANIERIVATNQGRLPLTMEEPSTRPLPPRETARLLEERPDWRLIDVREPSAFGAASVPGAINVQLSSPEFEQRLGWILDPGASFLLFADEEEDVRRAMHKLAFLGLDQGVQAYVDGGIAAWMGAGLPVVVLPQVSVQQLRERMGGNGQSGLRVVDVREEEEWREGHIEGACHMNFKEMGEGTRAFPFGREEKLAAVCAAGNRSSTGASLLRLHGFRNVMNVVGGMSAWRAAGYATVRPT